MKNKRKKIKLFINPIKEALIIMIKMLILFHNNQNNKRNNRNINLQLAKSKSIILINKKN